MKPLYHIKTLNTPPEKCHPSHKTSNHSNTPAWSLHEKSPQCANLHISSYAWYLENPLNHIQQLCKCPQFTFLCKTFYSFLKVCVMVVYLCVCVMQWWSIKQQTTNHSTAGWWSGAGWALVYRPQSLELWGQAVVLQGRWVTVGGHVGSSFHCSKPSWVERGWSPTDDLKSLFVINVKTKSKRKHTKSQLMSRPNTFAK